MSARSQLPPEKRMRILIAWELGGNYGHILSLLPIARHLQARGHTLVVVAADLSVAGPLLQAAGVALAQAPLPSRSTAQREIASYADILAAHGFADYAALSELTGCWQHIYSRFQPDAVLVNHAPGALVAARLARIPTAAFGTGFEAPPPCSPYPPFRPWLNLPRSALLETEARILTNLRRQWITHQLVPPALLCDAMQADAQLLLTFPEMDHYPERGNASYIGPVLSDVDGLDTAWCSAGRTKVFVYLHRSDQLESILNRLRQTDAQFICVIPGIDPGLVDKYQGDNVQVFGAPVKLAPLLAGCKLAITHCGHGTVSTFLLAGTALLLIPTQVEQMMLSLRIRRAGIGLVLSLNDVKAHFDEALERMLDGAGFTLRAQEFAARHADYNCMKTVERITGAIENLK